MTSVTRGAPEARGERGSEIARLIRVREKDVGRTLLCDERGERHHVSVSRVLRERGGIDDDHFVDTGGGEFRGHAVDRRAKRNQLERSTGLLRRRNGFPRRPVDATVTLFGNHEHHGSSTLASSRRCETSSRAASAAEPEIIVVFLPFSGK